MSDKRFKSSFFTILVTVCFVASGCMQTPRQEVTATTVTTTTTTVITTATTVASTTVAAALNETLDLDPTYERLLLVNAENPLPDGYSADALTSIPNQYCNSSSANKIDKGVYPYVLAMLKAARADGVHLAVASPYRSYATQKLYFNNKVKTVIANGTPEEEAEAVAATAVARPGTSEHQTGLAVDFNAASMRFETLPACDWMMEHAEAYGFILRYPENKTDITGVMYEPWHWRFVGINTAKEINQLGVTLEEYVALKNTAE